MAAPPMQGKGIIHVISKISRTDILDLETFMKWYTEIHIPEIVNTSGIRSARRFVNVDPTVDKPYLVLYPMDDIGFSQGEEFSKISVQSDVLPEPGIIYDLADVDVRYDNLIHIYDPTKKGKGASKMMVTFAAKLKEGESEDELDRWYREEVRWFPIYLALALKLMNINSIAHFCRGTSRICVRHGSKMFTRRPLLNRECHKG